MKNLSMKSKLLVMAACCVILPLLAVAVLTMFMLEKEAVAVEKMTEDVMVGNLDDIANGVLNMVRIENKMVVEKVDSDLNVAHLVLYDQGAPKLNSGNPVTWSAINQFTKVSKEITLPSMSVAGKTISKVIDFKSALPVVDEVQSMVGGTCTIFQRMNGAGDMLRIATNVKTKDGTRAVGTYIPAVNPDGTTNRVIASLMSGQTYKGRAYVVNAWYVTAYEPIFNEQKELIGALYVGVAQESIKDLRQAIIETKVGKSGYVFVIGGTGDHKGQYIISKDGARDGEDILNAKDADGNLFIKEMVEMSVATGGKKIAEMRYPWKNEGEAQARMKITRVAYYPEWDWVIGTGAYVSDFKDVMQSIQKTQQSLVYTFIAIVVLVSVAAFFVFYIFSVRFGNRLQNFGAVFSSIAKGDLSQTVEDDSRDEIGLVVSNLNEMTIGLADIVNGIKKSARSVAESADQIASGSQDQANRSQEQASALEETSSTIEELTSAIKQNADNAIAANQEASEAAKMAGRGEQLIERTITSMSEVTDASSKIAEIVDLVNGIAFQTNLLALNAAVEAARAGEQGKGFAVVAKEVRNLAGRSSSAAKEIQQLISDSNTKIQETNKYVEESGSALKEIISRVGNVAETISEIAFASQEQAMGIDQVNVAISEMDRAVQQDAAMVEESSASSEHLSAEAAQLDELMKFFSLGDRDETSQAHQNHLRFEKTSHSAPMKKHSESKSTAAPAPTGDFFDADNQEIF